MPNAERSFELEVNRAKSIVRVNCIKDPPENVAVFVGKRLESVLKWNTAPNFGEVDATLAGHGPCQFTASRCGENVLFVVHWKSPEHYPDLVGSIATLEHTTEVVDRYTGEPYTVLVGAYDYSHGAKMEEAPVNAALRMLLRNLHDPRTLACYSSTDLFACLPKVEASELEMRIQMFQADCRVEFLSRHKWNFGAKSLAPPFHFSNVYAACRAQAVKPELFAPEDLREAG
jgi:hypothetical protein